MRTPRWCRSRRRRWSTWSSTLWRAGTPAGLTAGRWGSFSPGTRQTPPVRALPGRCWGATARTSSSAGCLPPRSTSRSPPCASSPPKAAANGGLSPLAAAGIRGVPGARRSGVRTGNWLTLQQAQQLLAAPDPETTKGLRDRVLLGLLVGCGLRRGELAGLSFQDVAQREGRWAIVDLVGKHGRVRTVPMPSWARTALDAWASAAGISSGAVLRRVSKGGRVGAGAITPQGVFEAVVSYARKAGLGKITPHDLRRTFAKLAHLGRAPLEQIQISLGHASIQTTERYLGLKQNLHDAPCDRLGLVGWEGAPVRWSGQEIHHASGAC